MINENKDPSPYWANTSGNQIIYQYIQNSSSIVKEEFEQLIQCKSIKKKIYQELTYHELEDIDNIYSFLLFTGYLKVKNKMDNDIYELVIPNKEVCKIYEDHFTKYFNESIENDKKRWLDALKREDVLEANQIINAILMGSVSFYDNYEAFYHRFVLGLLSGYRVKSNQESGNGRFDVVVLLVNLFQKCIVIECKRARSPLFLEKRST